MDDRVVTTCAHGGLTVPAQAHHRRSRRNDIVERAALLPRSWPEMATFNAGSCNFGIFPVALRRLGAGVPGKRTHIVFATPSRTWHTWRGSVVRRTPASRIEVYDAGFHST